jgi:hypothetical protein
VGNVRVEDLEVLRLPGVDEVLVRLPVDQTISTVLGLLDSEVTFDSVELDTIVDGEEGYSEWLILKGVR